MNCGRNGSDAVFRLGCFAEALPERTELGAGRGARSGAGRPAANHGAAPAGDEGGIGQKHERGEITETERNAVLASFESDLAAGIFAGTNPAWADVFTKAENLATAHAATNLCRSLDTLHVALALQLGATEFCTFDGRQAVMAKGAGLVFVP